MKFIDAAGDNPPTLQLTRRNLMTLLAKLDDPLSHRTLLCPGKKLWVEAVEDDQHYAERDPGVIFMPSSGEYV